MEETSNLHKDTVTSPKQLHSGNYPAITQVVKAATAQRGDSSLFPDTENTFDPSLASVVFLSLDGSFH